MQNLVRAAQVSGILPIVRVKESCSSVMGEVLDIGAGGVQIPQITEKSEAEKIIQLTKFHPMGSRGVCRFVRAANYSSKDRFEYFKEANEALVIVQLEGKKALENVCEILQVKGIDIVFIGPYDLSQSLGFPGQIDHPEVEAKMLEIVAKCSEKGIAVGTFTDTVENAKKWQEFGIKYISYSVDAGIFYDAVSSIVKSIGETRKYETLQMVK